MPRETGTRQGTPATGDQHRGEGLAEDPPPEGMATQGTHTEHTQTSRIKYSPEANTGLGCSFSFILYKRGTDRMARRAREVN